MIFYLGTDAPGWLWDRTPRFPLFVSHRRLRGFKSLRESATDWALDSGGFTELSLFGEWRTTPKEYITAIRRYKSEIGRLEWASPQDWMCEPQMVEKTRRSIREHQELTTRNFLELRELAEDLPIIPVLQGWNRDDYLRHIEMYDALGIDLFSRDLVGMGSICRRAGFVEIRSLIRELFDSGMNIHGYGVKTDGLSVFGELMRSTDSMAWSLSARKATGRLCQSQHRSPKCAHCRDWATTWAERTISKIGLRPIQLQML